MPKICPLRMMARESDWDVIDNCGWLEDGWQPNIGCLGNDCAWWNEDFGECAIAAMASVQTHSIVVEEMRQDRECPRGDFSHMVSG